MYCRGARSQIESGSMVDASMPLESYRFFVYLASYCPENYALYIMKAFTTLSACQAN
jgi:hypothetical protein